MSPNTIIAQENGQEYGSGEHGNSRRLPSLQWVFWEPHRVPGVGKLYSELRLSPPHLCAIFSELTEVFWCKTHFEFAAELMVSYSLPKLVLSGNMVFRHSFLLCSVVYSSGYGRLGRETRGASVRGLQHYCFSDLVAPTPDRSNWALFIAL